MSDPAIEASKRALAITPDGGGHYLCGSALAVAAASEALKPLRELHKPHWNNCINACCSGEECRHRNRACDHDWDDWPCATARLIYSESELS